MLRILAALAVTLSIAFATKAAELKILPEGIVLSGARAKQQILVVEQEQGRTVADLTAQAKYTSNLPAIASISEQGEISAKSDGEVAITATLGSRTVSGKVRVEGTQKPFQWSFLNHVQPTLTRTGCNSGACHGALAGKGGFKLSLRAYDPASDYFTITRQASGRRVDGDKPQESLLLKKAIRQLPHGGGTRFDEEAKSYQMLNEWIASGFPGPLSDEPKLQSIEVFPSQALLKPKAQTRLVVRAKYSDGHTEDVTDLAKFTSNEEQAATIDETGLVNVTGYGEAGVSAIFGTKVATMTVTVPYPNQVKGEAYANAKKSNLIDEHVLRKLQLLNLEPSALSTDHEFIRRVYLDVAGILPKPEEVQAFVADTSSEKRTKLIDRLLDRPEYVDYWAHKWSDLLLVSSRKLPSGAMWSFYQTVRRSVADNQPWDRFARDILTASGSNLSQGGGNYFVLHKDVMELSESTAVTFLGMSINCARCHNHPLEKWTQDQYWAMANLFSRVGLKNGSRAGEILVQSLPQGDALHLRTGLPVPPAPLDGFPLQSGSGVDRRVYFADWLTKPENPFFAKAIVNRVWRALMGRGLVEAEDDIRDTNPPTNRELFDALTAEFVKSGFNIKQLIRLIVTSASYQRSSNPLPTNIQDDRFYSRYLIRRLSAEVILDAYSDISLVPTPFTVVSLGPTGGTANASYPLGTRAMQLPDSQLVSRFLDSFGRAERLQTCSCERATDASVGQALHLNNGQTLNDKLRDAKSRLSNWQATKKSDAEIVSSLFELALSRTPTAKELQQFTSLLYESSKDSKSRQDALEDVFWAVLTGKEFLFNH